MNPKKLFSTESYSSLVPLAAEMCETDLTPFDVYEKLAGKGDSFLLESALPNDKTGRYSIIGFSPNLSFSAADDNIEIRAGGDVFSYRADPIEELEKILNARRRRIDFPVPFAGGAAGFFSYDLNRFFEKIPQRVKEPSGWPDIHLVFADDFVLFDHTAGKIHVVSNYDKNSRASFLKSREKVENCLSALKTCHVSRVTCHEKKDCLFLETKLVSNTGKERYKEMVIRAKEYIRAGDIYQANLSHRLDLSSSADGLSLYRALRDLNPSPFASYLKFGGREVISCSPERLVKKEGSFIETRPIAGTRPRGRGIKEDFMMRSDLLLNEKERAEHIMLVDLERNDLGRIAQSGSVEVDEFMAVEKYSHVQHIVSNVRGIIDKDIDFVSVLRAVFPGGTITGVPKIRCMEIIDELEPASRGLYTGSIGYISDSGDFDLNIAIRTILKKGDSLSVQVGAGIVADSDPEREYQETLHKAEAMVEAVKIAENSAAADKLILNRKEI